MADVVLEPGRELDALVAEKVLGCRVIQVTGALISYTACGCTWDGKHRYGRGPHCHHGEDDMLPLLKHYSTSRVDALDVLDHFSEWKLHRWSAMDYGCSLRIGGGEGWAGDAIAKTPAFAICLAALEAKGVEI